MSSLNTENKVARIFPKLFIGDSAIAFKNYLKKHKLNYDINYIVDEYELKSFIDEYSNYKNYKLPVIISDISYLNKKAQSLLLKFMEDTSLNLILLASRDNILDTIISRTKEFRKYYISSKNINYVEVNKARSLLKEELSNTGDVSFDDKLLMCNKYNPVLAYSNSLVKRYSQNEQDKLVSLLEFNYER